MRLLLFLILILTLSSLVLSVNLEELTDVEKSALFDIFVDIPPEYHALDINDKLIFTLKLVNLGGAGRIDVFLEYSILDSTRKTILSKRDTVAIETQASFLREFDLEGIPPGDYEVYAKLIYADGKEADSKHSFRIQRATLGNIWIIGVVIVIMLLIVGMIFLYPKIKLIRDKMKIRSQVREIIKTHLQT